MNTDRLHKTLLVGAWLGSAALFIILCARIWPMRALYLSTTIRNETRAAMKALRNDTGWGLPNFRLRSVTCDDEDCTARLDFRYNAPAPYGRRSSDIRMTWPVGAAEQYALSKRP